MNLAGKREGNIKEGAKSERRARQGAPARIRGELQHERAHRGLRQRVNEVWEEENLHVKRKLGRDQKRERKPPGRLPREDTVLWTYRRNRRGL